jgi:hypothetical protein
MEDLHVKTRAAAKEKAADLVRTGPDLGRGAVPRIEGELPRLLANTFLAEIVSEMA